MNEKVKGKRVERERKKNHSHSKRKKNILDTQCINKNFVATCMIELKLTTVTTRREREENKMKEENTWEAGQDKEKKFTPYSKAVCAREREMQVFERKE